jgi:hypothetical protein
MSEPKWTFGKFVTKNDVTPMITVSGTSYVDTSTGDWTWGNFVTKNDVAEIIALKNTLPLPPLEPDEDTPELEGGPQR